MPTRTPRTPRKPATPAPAVVAEPTPAPVAPTPAPSAISGYRGLKVWQRATDLAAAVFHVSHIMADDVLAEELWRTALSIPASIAAGNSLYVRAEYVAQLSAAHGAVARLECLLHLADRISGLSGTDTAPLLASASDVGKMLRGLARALQPKEAAAAEETVH
jgi:four helix bundle protein